ncbi:MAG: hypothetical protein IJM98_08985 [Oscillospiraceae bacterium]|nr:hypothetical protein [Oscillospiraceae bacterium]
MSEINVLPFYRSYWEAAKNLSDTDRLKVYDGIFSFAFEGKEPLFEGISSCFWILSRPNIVKSLKKAAANVENGVKGGRPPKSQQEPNKKPIKTQQEPNEKADISLNKEQGVKNEDGNLYRGIKKFVPPTLEEIKAYCTERKNNVSAEKFFDFYSTNGWLQGKGKPIKDWRACIRLWEKNETDRTIAGQNKNEPKIYEDFIW